MSLCAAFVARCGHLLDISAELPQIEHLVEDVNQSDMKSMALGLSHSLGRYKLKFSPDKVDIMIVQAICTGYLDGAC